MGRVGAVWVVGEREVSFELTGVREYRLRVVWSSGVGVSPFCLLSLVATNRSTVGFLLAFLKTDTQISLDAGAQKLIGRVMNAKMLTFMCHPTHTTFGQPQQ